MLPVFIVIVGVLIYWDATKLKSRDVFSMPPIGIAILVAVIMSIPLWFSFFLVDAPDVYVYSIYAIFFALPPVMYLIMRIAKSKK